MKKQITPILLSGFLFFGQYFNSSYEDLEKRPVNYQAGIYLESKPFKDITVFLEHKTLMDAKTGALTFHPVQINYKLGLSYTMDKLKWTFQRECLHPVDGISGGSRAQSYNLIQLQYKL